MMDPSPLSTRTYKRLRQQGQCFERLAHIGVGSTEHTLQLAATIAAQEKFLFHLLRLREARKRDREIGEI